MACGQISGCSDNEPGLVCSLGEMPSSGLEASARVMAKSELDLKALGPRVRAREQR